MQKKTLWFDLETTGTDAAKHGIIQFAALVDVDGETVAQENIFMAPHDGAVIEDAALQVSGITRDAIAGFLSHDAAYQRIKSLLDRYCDKYDPQDKFYPAGYNVRFDLDFLQAMFKRVDRYGLGSYLNWRSIDPLPLLHMMDFSGRLSLPDYKLPTVSRHFGIDIDAHDALSDIRATRELSQRLMSEVFSL